MGSIATPSTGNPTFRVAVMRGSYNIPADSSNNTTIPLNYSGMMNTYNLASDYPTCTAFLRVYALNADVNNPSTILVNLHDDTAFAKVNAVDTQLTLTKSGTSGDHATVDTSVFTLNPAHNYQVLISSTGSGQPRLYAVDLIIKNS